MNDQVNCLEIQSRKAMRDPNLKVAEEPITVQAIRSILPFSDYNNKNRLNKLRDMVAFFCIIIVFIVLCIVLSDTRPASPIEAAMIKEFNKNLTDFGVTYKELITEWTSQKPFPLKESVNKNLISIDKSFAIGNLTLSLDQVNVAIGPKLAQ